MKILVLPFYLIGLVFGQDAGVTSFIIVGTIGFVCVFLQSFLELGFVKAVGYWLLVLTPLWVLMIGGQYIDAGPRCVNFDPPLTEEQCTALRTELLKK